MRGTSSVTLEWTFTPRLRGRPAAKRGTLAPALTPAFEGRTPRITRLMALAIKFDRLLRDGIARDYADLARLGSVTRARMTQIMNLLNLAPDIQEEILFLPKTTHGRDPVAERQIRHITAAVAWRRQRRLWRELRGVNKHACIAPESR